MEWLTVLSNVIFRMSKMTEEWRWSKSIKLISHTRKVWEKVIEVEEICVITEN